MAIKLVAIDLDDTLLDAGLKISQSCVRAIQEVQARGVRVTLATGRMYRSALPYAKQLQMDLPLITYQGALVKNSRSGDILYYRPVAYNVSVEIMQYFRRAGVHFHTYLDDQLYLEGLTEEGKMYSNLAGVEPVIVKDLFEAIKGNHPIKIMAVTDNEKMLVEMEEELKHRYGKSLNITRSKPFFLEIMDREANKADALQVVANHYGIKRSQVLAIGDSYNDLAMIEWAGIGVAMGNARKVVKDAADFVTSSNEEEGVTECLHRFVLERPDGN
ncbi:Cof-type HAD-IIB family hydrolase [Syntrophomonas erecta]